MGSLKFLFKLFKKNKIKNLIIVIQIIISVFACTFFIIPIVKSADTNKLIDKMDLESNIGFLEESIYIQMSSPNYTNANYEKLKNYIKNIDGVESIGSVYSLLAVNQEFNTIMYDNEIYNTIKLPLSDGNWFQSDMEFNGEFPVIISDALKDIYPLNSEFELKIDSIEGNLKEINIKCKVIGILKKLGYIYLGGTNHSYPSVSDLFSKTTSSDKIIIVPNLFDEEPRYWAYKGMMIKCSNLENIANTIKTDGIGELHNINELKENEDDNVIIYNEQKIYEFILVFIFILISISGYNTLANLDYRRILTIYYINGMTWGKGIMLLTIRNFLLIMIPTIISSVISNIIVCNAKTIYTFDIKNVYITVALYLIVFIITTLITILNLKKQKPIEVLREVE